MHGGFLGVFSYVKVFVYSGLRPSTFLSVPLNASQDDKHWRVAAFYQYKDYNLVRRQFSIGSGNRTRDGDKIYIDRRLEESLWYSVYFVAYITDNNTKVFN